ncbi:hypothetical protein LOD99_9462 [Oopsacas minuta]|uniref:Uncharacterized protein n=1 Tax=Oopsacas minuta TaxID=111878 RepID=A0AAV7JBL2_9METZ|nr:hypothetical protein LOD99_9462 [Oopsacas minuta]
MRKLSSAVPMVGVDLNEVLTNFRIKSIIYNFILTLSVLELIANVSVQTAQIARYDFNDTVSNPANISHSCVIRDPSLIALLDKSTLLVERIRSFGIIIWTMFPIIMSLFFVILRRLFINYPYKQHIRKYIIYIVLQFLVKIILSSFMQTHYFEHLLYFPFGLIDICIYISTSQKFYNLLKGNMNSANLHSTQFQYLQSKGIVKRFFYAQIFTLLIFSLVLSTGLVTFIAVPAAILSYNPCFLGYLSFGMIPNIIISKQLLEVTTSLGKYLLIIELICCFIVEVLVIVIYLVLSINIIVVLIIRSRKNSRKTDLITRPLLENYKNTFNGFRRY